MEQTVFTKKEVRKDGNRLGFSMLWYALISMFVSLGWACVEIFLRYAIAAVDITDEAEQDILFDEICEQVFEKSGTYLIVGVLLALAFLFLYFLKSGIHRELFRKSRQMTLPQFACIACVFFGGQLVFEGCYQLMEAGLNLIGYTAAGSMDAASATSQTISMFIYCGIVAPIAEELVYRGFALRLLEKYGKVLAILVSSVLFGIMHANLPQAAFAFCVGIVLGYVAMEYSIFWSILLHILNNMVLGDLFTMAIAGLPETAQNILYYALIGTCLLIGVIVLICRRKELMAWIRENRWKNPNMRWVLTTAGMLIFIALHLLLAISMLEKL